MVKVGDQVDLRELPIVRHHRMDPAPYIDMAPIMRDPEMGHYNIAFLRMMYKGPRKLGIHMSPRHNWQMCRKNELANRPTPVVIVVSHHPAFFLGALNVAPFGADDYEVLGAMMNEPIRLVPSETWGEEFMVPADAEMIIEGEIPPNVREVEGPFGEFPGTYGPQRLRWVIDVKAMTHRKQRHLPGHLRRPCRRLGDGRDPQGRRAVQPHQGVVPGVKAVHLPNSGVGRFNCYISIDKRVDGESKQAAFIALGEVDFIKNVHRGGRRHRSLQRAGRDVRGRDPHAGRPGRRHHQERPRATRSIPSQTDDIMTAKMIIDATKPMQPPVRHAARRAGRGAGAVPDRALPQGHEMNRNGAAPERAAPTAEVGGPHEQEAEQ